MGPPTVGYMTVTAHVDQVTAKTVAHPDGDLPVTGTVTLSPVGIPPSTPYLLYGTGGAVQSFLVPQPVMCTLIDGTLCSEDGSAGVQVLAPLQATIGEIAWYWRAAFRVNGQSWTVFFTGSPGENVHLPSTAYVSNLQKPGLFAAVWVISGTDIPPDALPGQYLVDTDDGSLYLIGADE